jgi:hypothetical protein
MKLLLEQIVPFNGGVCEVNFLENAGEQDFQQHSSLCFSNAASGCQVIVSLGGDLPPQLKSFRYGIASSAVVSPSWGPELPADVKGVLELHQDGLLVFGSPFYLHELSFRAGLAQDGLPYLRLLEDGQDAVNEELAMDDLGIPLPVGMQHGSNRRVTLLFQGEGQPKARISLDAIPIITGELGSDFIDLFQRDGPWKILPWSSLQQETPSWRWTHFFVN